MLKAMIVDDEAPARSELKFLLDELGQTEGSRCARSHRREQHLCPRREGLKLCLAVGILEVKSTDVLTDGQLLVVLGHYSIEWIACRRLDLDDLSPVISVFLRAVRPAEDAREIDDRDPGECSRAHCPLPPERAVPSSAD